MATLLSEIETLARFRLLESAALATPGSITVTPQGTTGTSTWTYKLVAVNANGTTQAGAASSTATGNATLSGANFNRLTWTAVTGAIGYWVYRTAVATSPTTTGRIAVLGAIVTFDDTGVAGDSSTAPTTNVSGLPSPFWTSDELIGIINAGIRDLWRDIVDLKQEHFLTIDATNVSIQANTTTLTGVPTDVHKLYLIEPRDLSTNGSNHGLIFMPRDYNHKDFQLARSRDAIDPSNDTIYYAVHQAGGPVGAPTILFAPKVTSQVLLSFCYAPVLGTLTSSSTVPIPGESDDALVAWTVAFARAKEHEDRSPDANWLAIYATNKQHILQSLGLRNYQDPIFVDAMFGDYWSWLLPLGISTLSIIHYAIRAIS
jgi:hypothetical protein